jgi:hypothetical protein
MITRFRGGAQQHAGAAKLPLPPKYLRPFYGICVALHDGRLRLRAQPQWRRVTNLA